MGCSHSSKKEVLDEDLPIELISGTVNEEVLDESSPVDEAPPVELISGTVNQELLNQARAQIAKQGEEIEAFRVEIAVMRALFLQNASVSHE